MRVYIVVLRHIKTMKLNGQVFGFYIPDIYLGIAESVERAKAMLKQHFFKIELDLDAEPWHDLTYVCYDENNNFKCRAFIIDSSRRLGS